MSGSDSLAGIHFMLPTPFDADGELDTASFGGLVRTAAESGCRGVVCLGVMGEAPRLSDDERDRVVDAVVEAAADGPSVTVGVTSDANRLVAARARQAEAAGASAVMVAPPRMAKPNPDGLFAYYSGVEEGAGVPIVVQDYPLESGVHMDPDFLAHLSAELPHARYLKLEDPPTPPKIGRILALTGDRMGIFGGLGGTFLFEELQRGAIGTMTGFAYPEALVETYRLHSDGDIEGARRVFNRWLPLIRYESQPGIGLSLRKHVLARRGLLRSALVRPPGPTVDDATRQELEELLQSMVL